MENAAIEMLPLEQLKHHPNNPRVDMGDLTELAASIRAKGVLQNLTVVRGGLPEHEPVYFVVIGNRRMEAAKLAGLKEVPCRISDMDKREQLAAMISENMHRRELSVYEQTQGIQQMLELGFSVRDIVDRTGLSETTTRRRIKMGELDRETLKKACGTQMTIDDFDRLSQVDSVKERNAILKKAGSSDFNWELNRTLSRQQIQKVLPGVKRLLKEAGISEIKNTERYGNKYDRLYSNTVVLTKYNEGDELLPKGIKGKLYCFIADDQVEFYKKAEKKKTGTPAKTKEEIAKEKDVADRWKRLEEDAETAKRLRADFVERIVANGKNALDLLKWLATAAMMATVDYETPREKLIGIMRLDRSKPYLLNQVFDKRGELSNKDIPNIILAYFEGNRTRLPIGSTYKKEVPKYKLNEYLAALYEWLNSFGYVMCDTERQLLEGTHQSFQTSIE